MSDFPVRQIDVEPLHLEPVHTWYLYTQLFLSFYGNR